MNRKTDAESGGPESGVPVCLDAWDLQLLKLLAAGKSYRRIARAIGTSASVVENSVTALRERFDARTDIHLVVLAVRAGLI